MNLWVRTEAGSDKWLRHLHRRECDPTIVDPDKYDDTFLHDFLKDGSPIDWENPVSMKTHPGPNSDEELSR